MFDSWQLTLGIGCRETKQLRKRMSSIQESGGCQGPSGLVSVRGTASGRRGRAAMRPPTVRSSRVSNFPVKVKVGLFHHLHQEGRGANNCAPWQNGSDSTWNSQVDERPVARSTLCVCALTQRQGTSASVSMRTNRSMQQGPNVAGRATPGSRQMARNPSWSPSRQ